MGNAGKAVHIVLFRWKPEATPEQQEKVMEALRGLRGVVPGILELDCGENFGNRAKGYQHGLVVLLESRAALEAYQPHPAHQRVLTELIRPIAEDTLAMDFEA